MRSVADVLDRAADLLTPEGAWTQRAYNRDAEGISYVEESRAICWCADGAIRHVVGVDDGWEAISKAFSDLALLPLIEEGTPWEERHVPTWNDAPGRTQAEVVAALREAARQSRQGNDGGGA